MKTIKSSVEKHNFRIRGKLNSKKYGGVFFGFCNETHAPIFGGGNLIYAPIWWCTLKENVEKVCEKIKKQYPDCECFPEQLN
jgi:hypothetical protein